VNEPAAAGNTVSLQNVIKNYGDHPAVRDVSLDLRAGEVFAFLGQNGAGKTTTLKLTCGLLQPDAGRVSVCGFDMSREAEAGKRLIAYVPDTPFLYDKLTGREFIQFTVDVYGIPARISKPRISEIVNRLDMTGFLDELAETYSHGMKQRVALAAALVHSPRLLVVDEPLVGLDPRTIRIAKTIFREIAESGGTVFMSTHTLDVAEQVADRIGILHAGRIVALGTLSELKRQAALDGRLEDVFLRITSDAPRVDAQANGDARQEEAA
jgi:ABC-2 type transport system ATP-binding protein